MQRVMHGRDGRNTKAYALRSGGAKITRRRKIVQVYCFCFFFFFPVFFTDVLVLFDTKVVLVFFLFLFVVILAVFVWLPWSFCYSNHAAVLALADSKNNILVLAFFPCAFLVLQYFFLRRVSANLNGFSK